MSRPAWPRAWRPVRAPLPRPAHGRAGLGRGDASLSAWGPNTARIAAVSVMSFIACRCHARYVAALSGASPRSKKARIAPERLPATADNTPASRSCRSRRSRPIFGASRPGDQDFPAHQCRRLRQHQSLRPSEKGRQVRDPVSAWLPSLDGAEGEKDSVRRHRASDHGERTIWKATRWQVAEAQGLPR